jgi:hypothetical protein
MPWHGATPRPAGRWGAHGRGLHSGRRASSIQTILLRRWTTRHPGAASLPLMMAAVRGCRLRVRDLRVPGLPLARPGARGRSPQRARTSEPAPGHAVPTRLGSLFPTEAGAPPVLLRPGAHITCALTSRLLSDPSPRSSCRSASASGLASPARLPDPLLNEKPPARSFGLGRGPIENDTPTLTQIRASFTNRFANPS